MKGVSLEHAIRVTLESMPPEERAKLDLEIVSAVPPPWLPSTTGDQEKVWVVWSDGQRTLSCYGDLRRYEALYGKPEFKTEPYQP